MGSPRPSRIPRSTRQIVAPQEPAGLSAMRIGMSGVSTFMNGEIERLDTYGHKVSNTELMRLSTLPT